MKLSRTASHPCLTSLGHFADHGILDVIVHFTDREKWTIERCDATLFPWLFPDFCAAQILLIFFKIVFVIFFKGGHFAGKIVWRFEWNEVNVKKNYFRLMSKKENKSLHEALKASARICVALIFMLPLNILCKPNLNLISRLVGFSVVKRRLLDVYFITS